MFQLTTQFRYEMIEPFQEFIKKATEFLKSYIQFNSQLTLRKRVERFVFIWLIFFFLARRRLSAARQQSTTLIEPKKYSWRPFSEFLQSVDEGKVTKVLFGEDDVLEFITIDNNPATEINLTRRVPSHLMPLVNTLKSKNVQFEQGQPLPPIETSTWQTVFLMLLPVAYVSLLGYAMYRFLGQDSQLGSNNVGDRGDKVKKRETKFDDVAGTNEAREAVKEVCDVLKNPSKYSRVGARLPSGILLVGPPGTGKTMLARAMANDAGIPFFYCAGSDFVEIYAGRGAARVRTLFQKAEKNAPAIIFIDEIDALGGSRHSGPTNNEEREQTLNQLLSCMDGFDSDRRIVVMAATNRFEYLDKALVRPGRFDRIVRVDLPNLEGRAAILKVHTRDMILSSNVDFLQISNECDGYSGAELASLANEAAIRAVRNGRDIVQSDDFFAALDTFNQSRNKGTGNNNNFTGSWKNFFQKMAVDLPNEVSEEMTEEEVTAVFHSLL